MLETGWDKVCDKVIFIDTPREMRLERVVNREGVTGLVVFLHHHRSADVRERFGLRW